jgi:hypothetical protein
MKIEFKKATIEIVIEVLQDFFEIKLSNLQLNKLNNSNINEKWTPAELFQICNKNLYSLDNTINDIINSFPDD